jgi:hypothetical protein
MIAISVACELIGQPVRRVQNNRANFEFISGVEGGATRGNQVLSIWYLAKAMCMNIKAARTGGFYVDFALA